MIFVQIFGVNFRGNVTPLTSCQSHNDETRFSYSNWTTVETMTSVKCITVSHVKVIALTDLYIFLKHLFCFKLFYDMAFFLFLLEINTSS